MYTPPVFICGFVARQCNLCPRSSRGHKLHRMTIRAKIKDYKHLQYPTKIALLLLYQNIRRKIDVFVGFSRISALPNISELLLLKTIQQGFSKKEKKNM